MQPPHYVLVRQQNSLTPSSALPLVHASVQYQYTDDTPHSLVPNQGEQVLVLDYDPHSETLPTIQSISPSVAVTDVSVEEAPGAAAAAADEGDPERNDRMFIIETTSATDKSMEGSLSERRPALTVLSQFKQRNAVLRKALLYPGPTRPSGES